MEADYQYFSFLVRAAMVDPAVIELNAMVSDEEDNLLFDIGAWELRSRRSHGTVRV
jgi:hypothetical protein